VTSVAAFVVLIVIIAIVAPPPKKPVAATITNPTFTPALAVPVFTPAPTAAPTAVPTAKPTAVPTIGFTKAGRGDTVFVVPAPYNNEATLVVAKYTGSSNFIVQTLASDNSMEALLVDTIGTYHGVVAMDFDGSNPPVRIEVQAGGAWSITLRNASTAPTFGAYTAGSGDWVVAYKGNANTAALAFRGQGNFIVQQYDTVGQSANLLADEIGNYNGTVPVDSSGFLVIQAAGAWSVTLSSS
jgi:hypothetical protein